MHTQTAIYVTQLMTNVSREASKVPCRLQLNVCLLKAVFATSEQQDGTQLIQIDGIGYECEQPEPGEDY